MVKKTFPIRALTEHALPKPNKINESKIKENTVELVSYGRKEEKEGEKRSTWCTLLPICNYGPCEAASIMFILAEGSNIQFFLPMLIGFAFGILGLSK